MSSSRHQYVQIILALTSLASLTSLIFILVPSPDSKYSFFLGYSVTRILLAFPVFVTLTISALFLKFSKRKPVRLAFIRNLILEIFSPSWRYIAILVLISILGILTVDFLGTLLVETYKSGNTTLMVRLVPFFAWLTAVSILSFLAVLRLGRPQIKSIYNSIAHWPTIIWVCAALFINYIFFFLIPVFLNADGVMFFPRYIPALSPIGYDLYQYLDYSASRLIQNVYTGNYPPFALILFYPLIWIDSHLAFRILTIINLFGFFLLAYLLPSRMQSHQQLNENLYIILILFVVGILSYGFQFEVERGQFNIIAMTLSLASIYYFNSQPPKLGLSYLLLTLAIQLKLWPGIFAIMLFDPVVSWKTSVKRIGTLLAINLSLLFILGHKTFFSFLDALIEASEKYNGYQNHSIQSSIATYMSEFGWSTKLASQITYFLFGIVAICLIFIFFRTMRIKSRKGYINLLCAAAIAACLVPAISNDYKLTILAGPMALYFVSTTSQPKFNKLGGKLLVFFVGVLYTLTLFPPNNKPLLLQNNMAVLLSLLILIVLDSAIIGRRD